MELSLVALIIALLAVLISVLALIQSRQNKTVPAPAPEPEKIPKTAMQLQAYERLVILTERLALHSLVSRHAQSGLTAREMQHLLIDNIKQEYDYNATQQIYVSQLAWDTVTKLKDQHMLFINQVASTLPPQATGSDLNKRLLELTMNEENGALHKIVLDVLNHEAKKIIQ